jgi:hypothetical protein
MAGQFVSAGDTTTFGTVPRNSFRGRVISIGPKSEEELPFLRMLWVYGRSERLQHSKSCQFANIVRVHDMDMKN